MPWRRRASVQLAGCHSDIGERRSPRVAWRDQGTGGFGAGQVGRGDFGHQLPEPAGVGGEAVDDAVRSGRCPSSQ